MTEQRLVAVEIRLVDSQLAPALQVESVEYFLVVVAKAVAVFVAFVVVIAASFAEHFVAFAETI